MRSPKAYLFLLVFIFSTARNYAQKEIKCADLQKGKFVMTGPSGGEILVKRRKKIQIERYNRENQKYKFLIKWIDDCTYTLTLYKAKGKSSAKRYYGVNVTYKIVNIGEDYHEVVNFSEPDEKPIEIFHL